MSNEKLLVQNEIIWLNKELDKSNELDQPYIINRIRNYEIKLFLINFKLNHQQQFSSFNELIELFNKKAYFENKIIKVIS